MVTGILGGGHTQALCIVFLDCLMFSCIVFSWIQSSVLCKHPPWGFWVDYLVSLNKDGKKNPYFWAGYVRGEVDHVVLLHVKVIRIFFHRSFTVRCKLGWFQIIPSKEKTRTEHGFKMTSLPKKNMGLQSASIWRVKGLMFFWALKAGYGSTSRNNQADWWSKYSRFGRFQMDRSEDSLMIFCNCI